MSYLKLQVNYNNNLEEFDNTMKISTTSTCSKMPELKECTLVRSYVERAPDEPDPKESRLNVEDETRQFDETPAESKEADGAIKSPRIPCESDGLTLEAVGR